MHPMLHPLLPLTAASPPAPVPACIAHHTGQWKPKHRQVQEKRGHQITPFIQMCLKFLKQWNICSSPIFCLLPSGLSTGPVSNSLSFSSSPHCPLNPPFQMSCPPVFDPQTHPLRMRHHYGGGFSLAEVHQELQTLQRQLANSERATAWSSEWLTLTLSLNVSTVNTFDCFFFLMNLDERLQWNTFVCMIRDYL